MSPLRALVLVAALARLGAGQLLTCPAVPASGQTAPTELGYGIVWTGPFSWQTFTGTTKITFSAGQWINNAAVSVGGAILPQTIPNCILNVSAPVLIAGVGANVYNISLLTSPPPGVSQLPYQCISFARLSPTSLRSWQTTATQACPDTANLPPASTNDVGGVPGVTVVTYAGSPNAGGASGAGRAAAAGAALAAAAALAATAVAAAAAAV